MVAGACGVFVAAMVGAAYAAVPLYNWFCRTTGFGGTPQVASAGPAHVLDRKVKVRFDANMIRRAPLALRAGTEFDRGQDRRGGDGQLQGRQRIRRARP